MPHQNRVTPFGQVVAYPERGTFMGNRGVLHDDDGNIRRQWALKRWIICLLEFKGRHREVMQPGRYTELFFLDEATALAAGHRPCAECRRADYNRFKSIWLQANPGLIAETKPSIDRIDDVLHAERVDTDGQKVMYAERLDRLPDGVFVMLPDTESAYFIWRGQLWRWSPAGYHDPIRQTGSTIFNVLTPRTIVKTIAAGYEPQVHETLD